MIENGLPASWAAGLRLSVSGCTPYSASQYEIIQIRKSKSKGATRKPLKFRVLSWHAAKFTLLCSSENWDGGHPRCTLFRINKVCSCRSSAFSSEPQTSSSHG